jgi:hypothetical protein
LAGAAERDVVNVEKASIMAGSSARLGDVFMVSGDRPESSTAVMGASEILVNLLIACPPQSVGGTAGQPPPLNAIKRP